MKCKPAVWIFLSAILPFFSQAASVQSYPARLASQSLLLDIVTIDHTLITVGERGQILRSEDGQNWQQIVVPSLSTLTAVYFVEDEGWAVGHDSTILHSEDKGLTWNIQLFEPELQRPLLDVLFLDHLQGIAIGAYGSFFRTLDGGKSWKKEMHPEFLSVDDKAYLDEVRLEDEAFYLEELDSILPHLNRISESEGRLYIAGEAGLLAYSDDQGNSWQRMDVDYTGSFFDIQKTRSGKLLASGLRGHLFEFDDDKQDWIELQTGSKSSLNSIVSVDSNSTIIVGNNGNIVHLENGSISLEQAKDGKAINNALLFGNGIIAVTGIGIKHL